MERLTYLDHMVLNEVYETGIFRDRLLSEQIGCSRMSLLVRLTDMISAGLISGDGKKYFLTKKGLDSREPVVNNDLAKEEVSSSRPIFTWENLYIPPEGWDAE